MAETMADLNVADLVAASKAGGWTVAPVDDELAARLEADPTDEAVAAAISEIEAGKAAKGSAEPETPAGGVTEARTQGEQTWLVQRTELIDIEPDDPRVVWVDVGEVSVPPRTKRKTIVARALELYPDATPGKDEKCQVRVLDADSAEEIPVGWEVPPAPEPVLRIG